MNDKGSYKFNNMEITEEQQSKPLSEVEKANDETLLYDRLKEWKAALIEATGVYLDAENKVIDCKNKIKYYEKMIKDYDKAFKK